MSETKYQITHAGSNLLGPDMLGQLLYLFEEPSTISHAKSRLAETATLDYADEETKEMHADILDDWDVVFSAALEDGYITKV